MELVKKPLRDIVPYEKNPRKNDDAVAYVMESIKQCTYVAPIIVDEDGVILAGHTRYKALKKLGYKEADVLIKEGLTEEQKRKYRLLDNKTNEFAEWDDALLSEELAELDFEGFDFGFFEEEKESEPNQYSMKVNIPQYEPDGIKPSLADLYNTDKTDSLIMEIEAADILPEQKAFLKTRLDRFACGSGAAAFGSDDYSKEELVAELGAANLVAHVGIETRASFRNSAAYLQGWMQVLKNDPTMIISAAGKAEKAVNYILGDA